MKRENINKGEVREKEEIQRIVVSRTAEKALVTVIEKVNDGFIGGKVNKTQMANWIFLKFSENLSEADIKEIRSVYFDEVSVLESILRKAKETGKVPLEFKGLLQKQLGLEDFSKRKNKKALTENIINDDIKLADN